MKEYLINFPWELFPILCGWLTFTFLYIRSIFCHCHLTKKYIKRIQEHKERIKGDLTEVEFNFITSSIYSIHREIQILYISHPSIVSKELKELDRLIKERFPERFI